MKWVKETQCNLPPIFTGNEAKKYVKYMLKKEANIDFEDVFSSFDEKPLGVASIGQVHRATLRATGQEVAVKLQLPNMESIFRADINTTKTFCELAMPQHVPAFDEIERQFLTGIIIYLFI
jgi:aarF domain-containing kinase